MIVKFGLLTASLILLFFACAGQKTLEDSIDHLSENLNGVVLISQKGKPVYAKAGGYSDFYTKEKTKVSDLFVIGSISKQITAVLILRSVEKGAISLKDTIGQYLPSLMQDWKDQITIHHLLTHTHGISTLEQPLEFSPGSQFNYSQIGYQLLADILEKANGHSFTQQSMALFKQMGLKNTFHPEALKNSEWPKAFIESSEGKIALELKSYKNYVPAGGFISNARDLAKWNELLYHDKLVKAETLQLMSTRYATRQHPIFGEIAYGYGLLFKSGEAGKKIGALGYTPGFASSCYYYPQKSISVVVLQNLDRNVENFNDLFAIHMAVMQLFN